MVEALTLKNQTEALKTVPEVKANDAEGQLVLNQLYNSVQLTTELPDPGLTGYEALRQKLFLATSRLNENQPDIVVRAADPKEPIEVPLDLVVDAQGFMSWEGRGEGVNKTIMAEGGYASFSSREVIARYANKSEEAPVIPEFNMYVQPDGKTFLANSNDGSHRLAAAIFNGKKTIPTLSLRVRYIPDLIF